MASTPWAGDVGGLLGATSSVPFPTELQELVLCQLPLSFPADAQNGVFVRKEPGSREADSSAQPLRDVTVVSPSTGTLGLY